MRTRTLSLLGGFCVLVLAGLIFGQGAFQANAESSATDPVYTTPEENPELYGYEFEPLSDEANEDGTADFFVAVPPEAVGGWVDLYEDTEDGPAYLLGAPIYEPVFLLTATGSQARGFLLQVTSQTSMDGSTSVLLEAAKRKPAVDPEMR